MLELAALVIFATGLAHSYLGEKYILIRLFRREGLPKLFGGTQFTVGTLRFAWHLTTIAWWAFAVLLAAASREPLSSKFVLQVIACAAFASAVLPVLFTRGKHLSWLAFLAVGALALAAS